MLVVACMDCDLLNRFPTPTDATSCVPVAARSYRHRHDTIDRPLALTCAALVLFAISNSFPFLAMESGGLDHETTMISGIIELWRPGTLWPLQSGAAHLPAGTRLEEPRSWRPNFGNTTNHCGFP